MNKEMLITTSNELRKDIIEMIYEAGSGHPGGSLSCIDILTYLYFNKMNVDVDNPKEEDRDRFILSKGHAAPALYAVLSKKGFFDKKELYNLRKTGSILQGHPDSKKTPGIDISTGSLGQGISNGAGLALAFKVDNKKQKTYVIAGDGEIQEGIVWETAMCAAKYKLNNLRVIIDYNKIQLDGTIEEIMNVDPLKSKWESFGWKVIECDGHNFDDIDRAFEEADTSKDKPVAIIANTVKGKGISFMENIVDWHGQAPNEEQKNKAIKELIY